MSNNAVFGLISLKTSYTYKNGDFLALLVLGSAHISEKATCNCGIAVLQRGRTSVSKMRFLMYGIILEQPKTAMFYTNRYFFSTSDHFGWVHVLRHPIQFVHCGSSEGSHNFLRFSAREIRIWGNFRGFGANLGPQNWVSGHRENWHQS